MDSPPAEEDVYNMINGDYMEPDPKYSHCYDYPELPLGREDLKPIAIQDMKPNGDKGPLEDSNYMHIIPCNDSCETPGDNSYVVPDYKPDIIKPVYAKLDTDLAKKSDRPRKKPSWWVWVLIVLGVSILCTLIVLVVVFTRGNPNINEGGSMDISPLPTNGPISKSTTAAPTTSKNPTTVSTNVVVLQTRIEEDSLSANSYCEFKLNEYSNRKLHSSNNAIPQPSSVDTKEKCKKACLGVGGDALLPSGQTCLAATFDENSSQCILTDSVPGSEVADGVVFIQVKYYCYPASAPGCDYRFRKINNRHLAVSSRNTAVPFSASSVPKCADGCSFFQTSPQRCQGFIFERSTSSCMLYTSMRRNTELVEEIGSDIYEVSGRSCVNCGDLYPTTSSGHSAEGGILQEGSFPNVNDCKRKCDQIKWKNGSICYGFDYSSRERTCHTSSRPGYKTKATPNTANYRRDIICYECSEPTKYISTVNTGATGGRLYRSSSFKSPYWCGYLCQGQSVGYNSPTCYGFSFNHATKACTLHHQFDFDLDTVGGSAGIDTYRRLYQCMSPESCKEMYSKTGNAASIGGGILQPKDINTVARCMDRCWGYAIGTEDTCYGFDFDREGNRCTVHIDQTNTLSPSDTIDSYKRNMNCNLPY